MENTKNICKYCDGTGTNNWCINGTFLTCEYCNGTGILDESEIDNDESEKNNEGG